LIRSLKKKAEKISVRMLREVISVSIMD